MKISLYIGHKLTKASALFLEKAAVIRKDVEESIEGCTVLKFLGTTAGTPRDVFRVDIEENVKGCDLFIGILDEESTGLGEELGAALWKSGKPVLLLRTDDVHVSRLPLGTADTYPDQILENVIETRDDAVEAVRHAIEFFRIGTDNPARFECLESLRDERDALELELSMLKRSHELPDRSAVLEDMHINPTYVKPDPEADAVIKNIERLSAGMPGPTRPSGIAIWPREVLSIPTEESSTDQDRRDDFGIGDVAKNHSASGWKS